MKKRLAPRQREALRLIAAAAYLPTLVKEEGAWYARWVAPESPENSWVDWYIREVVESPLTVKAEDQTYISTEDAWLAALASRTGLVKRPEAECQDLADRLKDWGASCWLDDASKVPVSFRFRTEGAAPILSTAVPKGKSAFRALGQAVFVFAPLRRLRRSAESAEELTFALTRDEADSFIRRGARELMTAGYRVEGLPEAASICAEVDLHAAKDVPGKVSTEPRYETTFVVRLAGHVVSAEEIRFLLEQDSSFVYFHDHWIEIDRAILKEALRALEMKSAKKLLKTLDALAFYAGLSRYGNLDVSVNVTDQGLRALLNQLESRGWKGEKTAFALPGLKADLRDYQARGITWLKFMTDYGFGALLADDMGLGKTIQTIGWLLATRPKGAEPCLVIAPLSLLVNWKHELSRFAPELKVYVHQGDDRAREIRFPSRVRKADVVLTSYQLVVRDFVFIQGVTWYGVVLDEAQMIKNALTRAAQAVSLLKAPRRIALTGTPIENRVADIWSLQNFLNPGYLGSAKDFEKRFQQPLLMNLRSGLRDKLKRILDPLMLRRTKSDPAIGAELGEKREIREYCVLSDAQRTAYEEALETYRGSSVKRGDVFALLTALKLACDGEGKMARLEDLLEGIFAAGESALVFTQYARVGEEIVARLSQRFHEKMPYLHGGLSPAQREAAIRRFNEPGARAFVLSLRAGGYGLNLTKATHVIHVDRWWNPAVENQATDRAHRIGQIQTVFVHLMITEGTLEERIDEMLVSKSKLAEAFVTSGDDFLRRIAPEELERLVAL